MTLVVSWAALDCKKTGPSVASVYFASDSRYSWAQTRQVYDYGQKVFGCTTMPEIFALCGDVNFPKTSIQCLLHEIDDCQLLREDMTASDKAGIVEDFIRQRFDAYDKSTIVENAHLYYGTRANQEFHIYECTYDKSADAITFKEHSLPEEYSDIVLSGGTGSQDFHNNWTFKYHERNFNYRTSRAVYHCFYETLSTTEVETVGRIPQIVGLYRKFNAKFYGIVQDGQRYAIGENGITKVGDDELTGLGDNIEWRNEQFEVTNPYNMKRMEGAQPQPFFQEKQLPGSPQVEDDKH